MGGLQRTDIGEDGGTPHLFGSGRDYTKFYTQTVAGLLRGDPKALVGGPATANPDSPLIEALFAHCAAHQVPLHFLSWHLYSDSARAHAQMISRQRARLAKFPQLEGVKLFISEWNMDLGRPNLAPGFQPAFVLEAMRRLAEEKLDMAAYSIRATNWPSGRNGFATVVRAKHGSISTTIAKGSPLRMRKPSWNFCGRFSGSSCRRKRAFLEMNGAVEKTPADFGVEAGGEWGGIRIAEIS